MNKKYEFTQETKTLPDGTILHRIRSIANTQYADAGELGGFIESEDNLPHDDISWVANEAMVYGKAVVIYDSIVSDHAIVCDHAVIACGAKISGHAHISGYSKISGGSIVTGRCSLNFLTSASGLYMDGINHVIRKGKSDHIFSKSDLDYSNFKEEGIIRPFVKDIILSIISGAFCGLTIGSLLLIF